MKTDANETEALLRDAFKRVYDPEFGVSVEDLGLIYSIDVNDDGAAVTMTLTSMYCPAGDVIMEGVKSAAEAIVGAGRAEVALVWDPLWNPSRLSAQARRDLGWDETRIEE